MIPLIPIFKGMGDIQNCGNYRGIKLMSHTFKIGEKVMDKRLRKMINISDEQSGFMPDRRPTDAIFALRQLMERYRESQRQLHCVFIDLKKAFDRVLLRKEVWILKPPKAEGRARELRVRSTRHAHWQQDPGRDDCRLK